MQIVAFSSCLPSRNSSNQQIKLLNNQAKRNLGYFFLGNFVFCCAEKKREREREESKDDCCCREEKTFVPLMHLNTTKKKRRKEKIWKIVNLYDE